MNKKQILLYICIAGTLASTHAQEPAAMKRVMEMRADRMYIYPQRMNLSGEETLGDILSMYPDLMQSGFDNLLSGYALRIDNVAISSDNRVACEQIKANTIERIQICDNTGVAKGSIGNGRVIDINLIRKDNGLDAKTGVEASTDNRIDHHAMAHYGNGKSDVFALSTYTYQDQDQTIRNRQTLFAHMTNRLSSRDRLLTYVTQAYSHQTFPGDTREEQEKCLARARYFHTFNNVGTELLIVGSYQFSQSPQADHSNIPFHTNPKNHSALYIVELNTPLTKQLDMMLGVEGDFSFNNNKTAILPDENTQTYVNGKIKYNQCNNDVYLQLNYLTGPWRLTVGDRLMFYHYAYNGLNPSRNDTRNNFEASAIVSLRSHSQIQAAYHKKYFNPTFDFDRPISENEWTVIKEGLIARYIDEGKLAYTFSKPNLSLNFASYYQNIEHAHNVWRLHASGYVKKGILSLTAGANLYVPQGNENDYATFRLNPHLQLPHFMQISVNSIFATRHTALAHNENVYTSLKWSKQWGSHLNTSACWHDMFSHHNSAVMATLQYRL